MFVELGLRQNVMLVWSVHSVFVVITAPLLPLVDAEARSFVWMAPAVLPMKTAVLRISHARRGWRVLWMVLVENHAKTRRIAIRMGTSVLPVYVCIQLSPMWMSVGLRVRKKREVAMVICWLVATPNNLDWWKKQCVPVRKRVNKPWLQVGHALRSFICKSEYQR
jgi:hypothetical protein